LELTTDRTMVDGIQLLVGVLLGLVLILPPGYVIGFALNILGFREQTLLSRLAISLVLSVSSLPILSYFVGRTIGARLTMVIYVGFSVAFCAVLVYERRSLGKMIQDAARGIGRNWPISLGCVGWAVLVAFSLADIVIGQQLYLHLSEHDYNLRVAVADAIFRTGVPPTNPCYYPGEPVQLFYYYFWFILCSHLHAFAGDWLSVKNSVSAMTAVVGFAVCSIVAIWWRLYWGDRPLRKPATLAVALGLLFTTGFDIIPVLLQGFFGLVFRGPPFWLANLEGWNGHSQITSWNFAIIWVPHHVGALVTCLTGMACLRWVSDFSCSNADRLRHAAVAGLAFASAVGMSIWMAMVAAAILAVWLGLCLVRSWYQEAAFLTIAGIGATLLIAPFLLDLHALNQRVGFPIAFEIRRFPAIDVWIDTTRLGTLTSMKWPWSLAFLPVNYFIEFGCFGVGTVLFWQWRHHLGIPVRRVETFCVVVAAVSLLVCTFVRSTLVANDLGWRGTLFAQFVMLLWTASFLVMPGRFPYSSSKPNEGVPLEPSYKRKRVLVLAFVTIGLIGVVYDVAIMRVHRAPPPGFWESPNAWVVDLQAERAPDSGLWLREAYLWAHSHTPATAVFQHNPVPKEHLHGLYGNRQVALANQYYGKVFGISDENINKVLVPVRAMFLESSTWDEVQKVAGEFGIDWVVVEENDPIWAKRQSWVWERTPDFANRAVRLFAINRTAKS
jgi:hypothetical protein